MNLVDRIKGILLQPKSEWSKIDSEPGDAGYLLSNYVAIVAAIAPICTFIGTSIIGIGGQRIGIGLGLFRAVVVYVLTLIGFFLVGYIIDFLAGTFGARKNLASAMKVSAYAPTAAWLAGVFNILPALSFLSILGLYSLYPAVHRHRHADAPGGEQCADLHDYCRRVRDHRLGCHPRHPGNAVRNGNDDVAPAQGSALRCRIGRPGAIACAAATMAFASMP